MTKSGTGKREWIWTVLLLVAIAGIVIFNVYRRSDWYKKNHVKLVLKPYQTSRGWGYNILTNDSVFIHQDVIPAIGGRRMFKTREDALVIGNLVYEKVLKGDVPMVTPQEVRNLIDVPTDSVRMSEPADTARKPTAVEKR
jgi:hypothetical protein